MLEQVAKSLRLVLDIPSCPICEMSEGALAGQSLLDHIADCLGKNALKAFGMIRRPVES